MINNLSVLQSFVIVAKHLSFSRAANELNLTQGAVSIQIRQLEEELGFKLFNRGSRGISLTVQGAELLEVVEPSLKQIFTRIESIRTKGSDESLTVSTLSSFASKWLIPRVLQFQQLIPQIDLRVHTSDDAVDFVNERVDCAVRYGLGNYSDLFVEHIIDEIYFPVFSPDLLKQDKPLEKPEDVKNYPILHDDYANEDYNITWERWAEAMGISDLNVNRGMQYGQSDFVIQAAIAGQGIALAKISLAGNDLKSGLLISLPNSSVVTEFSYYFVCPRGFETIPKIVTFRDWIIEKMQTEAEETKKYLSA